MQKFVLQLDTSIKDAKLSLVDMFKLIDSDNSGEIDFYEFEQLFRSMNL